MKRKTVYTNGCFDVLHYGHIALLEAAKLFGTYLIVGINSDESVRRLKGNERPINNVELRRDFLLAIRCVDDVLIFEEDTPLQQIMVVQPDVLVKGNDYNEDSIVGADYVKSYGGSVEIVPKIPNLSTSEIIERL